jgi:predicted SprT family Zn-dependent metalloprotease
VQKPIDASLTKQQEASEAVMELHDDDPDHFKFALEFIYTQHYNHNAANAITGKDDVVKRIQFAMGLYTVANKYEITKLMSPAANDLRSRLIASKSEEVLKSVIRAHYRSCSVPEHHMGKIIAKTTMRRYHAFFKTADFKSLLATIPAFASDIALACHAEDCFNLRVHYCKCGEEFLLRGPHTNRDEVITGSCHTCKERYMYGS